MSAARPLGGQLKTLRTVPIVGVIHMTNMLLNILIGLTGWTILAVVAGLCIGNALRVAGQWDGTAASVPTKQTLKKTA
jgi:hypothetical protein